MELPFDPARRDEKAFFRGGDGIPAELFPNAKR